MSAQSMFGKRFTGCVTTVFLLAAHGWATERQNLSGHVPAAAVGMHSLGRLRATDRLNLTVVLPLRNHDALHILLGQLYDPSSPQYRHYLTPTQFAEKFGPSKEDYDAVVAFMEAHGLAVTSTHPNRTLLDINGSVADLEKAFHLTLQTYRNPKEGRVFYAPDSEPSLDLAVPLLHIGGLNDLSLPRSLARKRDWNSGRQAKPLGGSGPDGGFIGKDFRAAYVPGVALTGSGQSLAVVEFRGYYTNDIVAYEKQAGLPSVPVQNVYLNGVDGTPGGGTFEVALDIEMAIAMAPGLSQVLVYEGRSSYTILNRIATDNAAKQISCSWTLDFDSTTDQMFQQYAAQGQSFFQASGDWGPNPGGWVADDPYITTVGGTVLKTSGPGGSWVSETVWNLGYILNETPFAASGGGISATYPIPSWQKGVSMAQNRGSLVRRNSPDVSMVADDVWVTFDNGFASSGAGTSTSAPLWAGFTALANELAAARGLPSVGFINPSIYRTGKGANYGSAFHDVTVGSNVTPESPANFFAVSGYDLCTGWGSPSGSNLLYALALPDPLLIMPETNFVVGGQAGGPFIPLAQVYSLTNAGTTAVVWTMAASASWVDLSTTSGTLAPGDPATSVTASLSSDANLLPAGTYAVNLWFTNLSGSSVQSRPMMLKVFSAPVIVAGPISQTVPDGGTAEFTVVAAEIGTMSYQWTRNGVFLTDDTHISGSRARTLIISNASIADAASYSVFVTNSIGASSSGLAVLTVVPSGPVITMESTNQTALAGETVAFAVQVAGTPPLFYQWRYDGTDLTSVGNTNVLTLRDVSPTDDGVYSVVVSNALGTATNTASILTVIPVTTPEVNLATLYSFGNGKDGANPNGLIQATDGFLYGTTDSGGASRNGTVFRMTTNGALTALYAFSGGSDGGQPRAGVIQADDGNLYGTTFYGGAGEGVVFTMSLTGGVAILHSFMGANDGGFPMLGVVQASDGDFYGAASSGGTNGFGTVFKMTRTGTLTTLHSFNSIDGADPHAGVIQGKDGYFYGITRKGGARSGDGTLFKISANGAFTSLFDFDQTNGWAPRAGLRQGRDGNFYGSASSGGANGGGTVFRMTASGLLKTLHSFNGSGDGEFPEGMLLEGKDGYFYGTTLQGGKYDQGTIFRMSPSGQLTTIVHFDGFNGANPSAPLMQADDGSFYGSTLNGGANGYGTVFRLIVPTLRLHVVLSGRQLVLSWPAWASDMVLQQTADLTRNIWTTVTNAVVVTDSLNQVILSPGPDENTFYRLTH
jgi:uncharacterized repeat protein (TIGR03803 family)